MTYRSESYGTDVKCRPPWLARTIIVAVGLGLWFFTQSLIGSRTIRPVDVGGVVSVSDGDFLFTVTRPVNTYLHTHPRAADVLLVASSAAIDAIGIWLIASSLFGPSMRPFLGLLLLFALRQLMQAMCALPPPDGMIWRSPGWPSLFVTYHVANDFFFSGHTAIAVFGATQLARTGRPAWVALGIALALFEMAAVLVLRAHYTMDVFTGAIAALWAAMVVERFAPAVDHLLISRHANQ